MPALLDPATLPRNVVALRDLLLRREAEHAAERAQQASELDTAREGLKAQVLRNEQLKLRLAKLLRERFGASSEKLRSAIDQLELLLEDVEEQIAETTPAEPEPPAASETTRRKPVRKPLPATLPRDIVEHAAPCACPQCGGALRPLGEDVTEVLDYVPGAFRVIRHVRPKLSCRNCESIAQAPAPDLPIRRGLAGPGLLAHVLVAKYLRPPAAVSPGRDLCPQRHRSGSLDPGGLGGTDGIADAAAGRGGRSARDGGRAGACRRHHGAGARPRARQDQDRTAVVLRARRPAIRRPSPAGCAVLLQSGSQRRTPADASRTVPRHLAGRRLCRLCRAVWPRRHRGCMLGSRAAQVLRCARQQSVAAGARSAATDCRIVCGGSDDARSVARRQAARAIGAERSVVRRIEGLAGE